jgi:hypothetical protein
LAKGYRVHGGLPRRLRVAVANLAKTSFTPARK